MQTLACIRSTLQQADYLSRMINSHELCNVVVTSVLCKDKSVFAIKCNRYSNICLSVLQSVISFAKVEILTEEEVFK